MSEGCPCNSKPGCNTINGTRWRLLRDLQQQQSDELADLRDQVAQLTADNDAGREYMRKAWFEMNAIRAHTGAPAGVCHEYWNELVEQLNSLLGDDAKPWMAEAARLLTAQLTLERDGCRDLIATLRSRVAEMELNRLAPPADGAEEKATDAP